MSTQVYSERFLGVASTGAWVYWTCPSGQRAVVRHVSFGNNGGQATGYVSFAGVVGVVSTVPAFGAANYPLSQVVYAGEAVGAYLQTGAALSVVVSGFMFRDPTGGGAPLTDEGPAPPGWVAAE